MRAAKGRPGSPEAGGLDPLDVTRCGVLPSVARALGLPAADADPTFLHGGHRLDIKQFVCRVAPAYRSASRDHLENTLHQRPEVSHFLSDFTKQAAHKLTFQ